jgi:hypothetical protein
MGSGYLQLMADGVWEIAIEQLEMHLRCRCLDRGANAVTGTRKL